MVNEFVGKKLGEILAFAEVGAETWERGQESLALVLGADVVADVIARSFEHARTIRSMAEELGTSEVTLKKLEGTGKKLREMRDLYVGDQWHNPVELLEWSGFFEGAAVVHFALVRGAGEGLDHEGLTELGTEGADFHQQILDKAEGELHSVGQNRSQE
jgi:hypothetical protein